MRRAIIWLACLLPVASVWAQPKNPGKTLPNVVPVKGDYLFAATSELTNFQYLEFLWHMKQESEETWLANLPDSTVWKSNFAYNEPYVQFYHKHPAYRDYPAVGLSHEQAKNYCAWLTNILNESLEKYWTDNPAKKIVARLPTREEWLLAARGELGDHAIFPWEGTSMRHSGKKYEGQFLANFKRGSGDHMGVAGHLNDNADVTAPVFSYWPNSIGLYNMSGNVAEMLAEPGYTMGGSWRTTGYYLRLDADDYHAGWAEPQSDIGMRYFIEVLEWQEPTDAKELALDARTIEKAFLYLNDTMMAAQTEVSNAWYNRFLQDLEKTDPKAAEQHRIRAEGWDAVTAYTGFQQYSKREKFADHPVVNITHESAQAFCKWLTETYRKMPNRKYPDVTFQLPAPHQSEFAARGGHDVAAYPWGGPYLRNSKGDFLCNFQPEEHRFQKLDSNGRAYMDYGSADPAISRDLDGHAFSAPCISYFPNDYGLYNCAGNVAEMTSEAGVATGGSWKMTSRFLQNGQTSTYEGPQPDLGFRVFGHIPKGEVISQD